MPIDQARGASDAVASGDLASDAELDLLTETGAHVAQTIDPSADGCRTIVLTVDAGAPTTPSRGADPSILDGGLDTTWVVPSRGHRFGRAHAAPSAAIEETVITLGSDPAPVRSGEATGDVELPAGDLAGGPEARPATERPRASFHATGDEDAVARVDADRRNAERRHAERRRRRAEAAVTTPGLPRRRSGRRPEAVPAAVAPAAVAPVERHTVRISGTPDPLLATGVGLASPRRRPGVALNPVAGLVDRPDRIAMWAVLLGVFLVLVAATSG